MTGVTPTGSGCQPTASAADASSQSGIPNAGWVAFNVNRQVKVKLTEAGMAALREEHQRYADFMPKVFGGPFTPPKTDDAGYVTYQLWQIAQTFGPVIRMGAAVPFETTILLEASAIEAATAGETGTGSTEGESAVGTSRDAQPNP